MKLLIFILGLPLFLIGCNRKDSNPVKTNDKIMDKDKTASISFCGGLFAIPLCLYQNILIFLK